MSNFHRSGFDNSRFFRRVVPTLLRPPCVLCAGPALGRLLCGGCAAGFPALPPHCPRCAVPTPRGELCGRCRLRPPAFAATRCAWVYAHPVDALVQALKYHGRAAFAEIFADVLAGMDGPCPDALVPLPLAPARQRQRGFNQAAEIARHLAGRLELPVLRCLRRTRDTTPQAALPLQHRGANVAGAFAASDAVAGLRVALVDDVMTSGATLHAAALALLGSGALRVEAWVAARTLPPESLP